MHTWQGVPRAMDALQTPRAMASVPQSGVTAALAHAPPSSAMGASKASLPSFVSLAAPASSGASTRGAGHPQA
jgi:hypothetical protein